MMISHRLKLVILFFSILELVVYLPFIQRGGFSPADDLLILDIMSNMGFRFNDTLDYYFSTTMIARPLSMILRNVEFIVFKNNQLFYILFQLALWFFSMSLIASVLKSLIGPRSFWIFFLFSSFPILCSSIIHAPYLAIEYGFPTMFSGLSLVAFHRYSVNPNILTYIIGYLFSIIAILFSSLVFPLLILAVSLPFLKNFNNIKNVKIDVLLKLMIKNFAPLFLMGIIFFIYKVFITPFQTGGDLYGFSRIDMTSVVKAIYYYYVISIEPVLLLLESIRYLNFSFIVFIIFCLVSLFFYSLRSSYKNGKVLGRKQKMEQFNWPFIYSVMICLFLCSGIFLISRQPCVTYGWYNRIMMPSFILWSIIVTAIIDRFLNTKWLFLIIIVSFLWIFSMKLQVKNFIQSWELREKIFLDISEQIKLNKQDINVSIIACVPFFLKNNYNNEEVSFGEEFFSAGLRIYVNPNVKGNPFCWRSVYDKNSYITFPKLPESNKINYSNLWYYEFVESDEFGSLGRINNEKQLDDVLENVKEGMINYHPSIFREKIYLYFRSYFL